MKKFISFLLPLIFALSAKAVDAPALYSLLDDFQYNATDFSTVLQNGATFAADSTVLDSNHPGIWLLSGGSGTTSQAVVYANQVKLGASADVFDAIIQLSQLSDVTDEYDLWVGFCDDIAGSNCAKGIFFHYNRNVSVNWLRSTAGASITETATTVPVVADAFIRLTVKYSPATSKVTYFINGVNVGQNTTNIPAATAAVYPLVKMVNSAGTSATRLLYVDYLKATLLTSRGH